MDLRTPSTLHQNAGLLRWFSAVFFRHPIAFFQKPLITFLHIALTGICLIALPLSATANTPVNLTLDEDFGSTQVVVVDGSATQTITYNISTTNVGFATLSIDAQSGTVTITSIADAFGAATITVTVNDGAPVNNRTENLLTLTVLSVPDPVIRHDVSTVVSTYAGTGSQGRDNGPALQASIRDVFGLALHDDGRLFFADFFQQGIRVISADGSTVSMHESSSTNLVALDVASDGRLFFSSADNRISVLGTNGVISRYAGSGRTSFLSGGYADGDSLDTAEFNNPWGIALTTDGRVFVVDRVNHRIRVISADGSTVSTYAGTGTTGFSAGGYADGDSLNTARFFRPRDIALAADGRLFVADTFNNRIRVISADGSMVSTYAGSSSTAGFADGSTSTARFSDPRDIALAADGRLFVADTGNHRIRVISADGSMVSTYAGNGQQGLVNGLIAEAVIQTPVAIAVSADGRRIFVATIDAGNYFIRLIETLDSEQTYSLSSSEQSIGAQIVPASLFLGLFTNPDSDSSVTYSFQSGNDQGFFTINSADGSITLNALQTEPSQATTYNLVVVADNGVGAATTTITIQLSPLDNYAPSFTLSHTALSLTEDFGSAQITVLNSDDGDLDVTQTLTYSISSSNPGLATLAIDPQSGTLTITSVDNVFGVATITVTVNDNENFNNIATQTVSLALSAVNDPPNFSLSTNVLTVAEDFSTIQVTVLSSDDGDGTTQAFTYSISTTNVSFATLTINTLSGAVTINSAANAFGQATITVTAIESVDTNSSSTQLIVLTVLSVPDLPLFTLSTTSLSFVESFNPVTVFINDQIDRDRDVAFYPPFFYTVNGRDLQRADVGGIAQVSIIDSRFPTQFVISHIADTLGMTTITIFAAAPGPDGDRVATRTLSLSVRPLNHTPTVVVSANVRSYAGNRVNAYADGSTSEASFMQPLGLALAPDGRLFVADADSNRIRVISADGATVSTYAGNGVATHANGNTSTASFSHPEGLAFAPDGRLFVADSANNRIRVISADGATVSDYAGSGELGKADGSTSTASFSRPIGLAVAPDGRLFVADSVNARIRVISADGAIVSTYAGSGELGNADGSTSTATFDTLNGLALAPDGRLFVADTDNNLIRVISADGATVSTYAGSGEIGNADGSTSTASFRQPIGLALAPDGRLFIADHNNNRIRVISADGATVSNYTGASYGFADGALSEALFRRPNDIVAGPNAILFVSDNFNRNIRAIQEIDLSTRINSDLSTGTHIFIPAFIQGLFHDVENDTLTYSIASGNTANLFAIDANGGITLQSIPTAEDEGVHILSLSASDPFNSTNVLLTITVAVNLPPTFTLSTNELYINQNFGSTQVVVVNSDDGDNDAIQTLSYSISTTNVGFATLNINAQSGSVAISSIADAFGVATITITVDDSSSHNSHATQTLVLRVNAAPTSIIHVSTYAGDGLEDNDNGDSLTASFQLITDIEVAPDGRLFVVDVNSEIIRVISADGATVSDYAGGGNIIDAVSSTANARLLGARDIARAPDGRLFVNSRDAHTIRVINAEGTTISNYAGLFNISGAQNGSTQTATFSMPDVLATAPDGRLFVIDANFLVRVISTDGTTVSNYAGVEGDPGFIDGITTTAQIRTSLGMVASDDGTLFIADTGNNAIRVINAEGTTLSTYAGDGGRSHRNGDAENARFDTPASLALAQDGRLFIADSNNHRIRIISADGATVSDYAGSSAGYTDGPLDTAQFSTPSSLAVDDWGRLFVAEDRRIRIIQQGGSTLVPPLQQHPTAQIFSTSTIQALFNDGNNDALTYNIIAGNESNLFTIDSQSGLISLTTTPIDSQAGYHALTLVANDDFASATSTLIIYLAPINNPPIFTLSTTAITVNENFITQTITVVSSDDGDVAFTQTLTYSISTTHTQFANFAINPQSGTVTITNITNAFGQAVITVTVAESSNTDSIAIRTVTFIVNPVNELPSFTLSTNAITVNEDFGTIPITITNSSDGDDFITQTLSYSISTTNLSFATLTINAQSGTVTINSIANAFGQATITVTVDDSSDTANIATQTITLNVNPVNDAPEFTLSTTTLLLNEDFGNAQLTITNSNDGDVDGVTQTITYSISTTNVGFATLAINTQSGAVTINSAANAFGQATIHVIADDSGAVDNLATQTFSLTVNSVNDSPSFTLSTSAITVNEDFGTIPVTVTTSSDGDDFITQTLNYSISTTNLNFATLAINAQSGAVTINNIANAFGQAAITVTVDDSSATDNIATQTFTLTVNSVNELPSFTLSTSAITVNEDFGTIPVTVTTSSDGDDFITQTLNYSISTTSLSFATLAINAQSGAVTINSVANAFGQATITVTVDDSSATNNIATQTFTLTVNSVNELPSFTLSTNAVTVNEDFGTIPVTITNSSDGDDFITQTLSYSISTTSLSFATLAINAQSGAVTINSVANAFGQAIITVTVDDSSDTDNLATQTFTLTVNSVNELPSFTLSTNAVTVNEDFGTIPVTVTNSSDGDDFITQTLSYSISTTNLSFATLTINTQSGEVTINSVANAFGQAIITVTVDDSSDTANIATQTFTLTVNSVNDTPIFTLSTNTIVLNEDFGSAQVTVSSSDDGDDLVIQTLAYSISTTNVGFAALTINTQSGAVTINSAANAFGQAIITVTVDDSSDTANIATQTITLNVNPVNDAPEFTLSTTTLLLNEDFGNVQLTITNSNDGDVDGVTQTITYSISTTNVGFATLAINTQSGAVTINSVANAFGQATIHVIADDGSAVDNLATQTFTLTVNPVNELPSFTLSTSAITVNENFGTVQVTVSSSDDGDDFVIQTLAYSISTTNVGIATLAINTQSGAVTINSAANAFGQATITVTVDDSSDTANIATQTITLNVNPVNDPPEFTLSTTTLLLNEDFGNAQLSITNSNDGDVDGVTQTITYSISTTNVGFATLAINTQSGAVTINSVANAFGEATIHVIADDGGAVDNLATRTFSLEVTAVIDPPVPSKVRIVSDYAGSGQRGRTNGNSATARFDEPRSIIAASDGRLFVIDTGLFSLGIRVISTDGKTVSSTLLNNGVLTNGRFNQSDGMALTTDNRLIVTDRTVHRIYILDPDTAGSVQRYAGSSVGSLTGAALSARFNSPTGVALTTDGRLFIADSRNQRIRALSADGATVSNKRFIGVANDIAIASDGRVFVSTHDPFADPEHLIHVISADNASASVYAGDSNIQSGQYQDGDANTARFNAPYGLALAPDGRLFIVDRDNLRIRVVSADGKRVSTYAGNGAAGHVNGHADSARFNYPYRIAYSPNGRLFVADTLNHRIRVIDEIEAADVPPSIINLQPPFIGTTIFDANLVQDMFFDIDETTLTYAIVSGNETGLFSISSATGLVSLKAAPTDEQESTYTLIISASNTGGVATNTLSAIITPFNHPPIFTLSSNTLALDEDFTTQILTVTNSEDGDVLTTQTLSYSISTTNLSFATLAIDTQSGTVTINNIANAFGQATITVTVDDSSTHSNIATQTVVVTVQSINDPPEFALSTAALTAAENFDTITATVVSSNDGEDLATTQLLSYSVSTTNVGFATLAIDTTSGQITLNSVTNRFGQATITITVDDSSDTDNIATQTIVLTVQGINDPPSFEFSTNTVILSEDFGSAQISVVNADDGDIDAVQILTYSVSPELTSFAFVSIDQFTGELTITGFPNQSGSATFTITVDDSSDTDNLASRTLSVIVQATNDPPQITLSATELSLIENFTTTQIFVINSNDGDDDGITQNITYHISTVNFTLASVSVHPFLGTITLASIPQQTGTEEFFLVASDGDSINNYTTLTITLNVNPLNIAPTFELSTSALTLNEDFSTTQVHVLNPDDGNDGVTQVLTYSISTTNLSFATLAIDTQSGAVTITNIANAFGQATITVTVDDSSDTANIATQTFSLTVNPVNDSPSFTLSTSAITVNEDFGTIPVTVTTSSDGDDFITQSLTYSISTTNLSFATLAINTQSGAVTINSAANAFGQATITVTVDDSSATNNIATQTVTLTVNPVNDSPVFTLSTTTLALNEDFGNIQVTINSSNDGDVDGITQTLSYSINTTNTGFATLTINPLSGTINISSLLDALGNATITVTANDGDVVNNLSTQVFSLTIIDINTPPRFDLSITQLNLEENFTTNTDVFVINPNDGDITVTQTLSYSITPSTTHFATLSIDQIAGSVTINSIGNNFGRVTVSVVADDSSDTNNRSTQTFILSVGSVNDPPTFTLSTSTLVLNEDFSNAQVTVSSSDDGDALITQTLSYSINTTNVGFATLTISTISGAVTINSVANAFGQATITVTVDDSSATDNIATQTFALIVNSVNELPSFTLSTSAITVNEDFSTIPVTVTNSSDGDDFITQTLSYSVSISESIANLSIHAQSGALTITNIANAFGQATITVTVDDSSDTANIATQTITLNVNPVNDAPEFTLSTTTLLLNEDFGNAQLTITNSNDGDVDGVTQTITYSINTTNVGFATLAINTQSGAVTINSVANAFGQATIHVIADDGGAVDNLATQTFSLTVNSVNELPSFTLSTSAITVNEDFGTIPVTVTNSSDGDDFITQTLTYSISTTNLSFATLAINTQSGAVTINNIANAFGQATITVTVDDSSATDNIATQTFSLTVNSVNELPSFTLSTSAVTVNEDFGTILVTVTNSSDGDDFITQTLTYSVSISESIANLAIDAQSGTLSITNIANAFGQATITVTVDDSSATNNIATQTITLNVNPVNDSPVFTLSTSAVTVNEDFATILVTVTTSSDGDDFITQTLNYSISTTNLSFATLAINAQSGAVTINSVANAFGQATITVTVDDSSATNNIATQTFTLTVNPVNDAPEFTLSTTTLALNEDFGNIQVTINSSNDGDVDGITQTLSYSINTTNTGFATLTINPLSGTINISSLLDALGNATITVTANDGGVVNNLSTQVFSLTIIDINTPPRFDLSITQLNLEENFTTNTDVFVINPNDGDITVTQTLSYSITPSTTHFATLSIDQIAGSVTINSIGNNFGRVTVSVVADDSSDTNNRSTQTFILSVGSVNDPPTFTLSTSTLVLNEDFGNAQVTVSSSDDGDALITQTLSYSINTTNVGFATLTISTISGAVTINSVANAFGQATITVTVDDSSATDNIATQTFALTVNSVNELPSFTLSTSAVTVNEDFGTIPVTVTNSSDGDDFITQTLSYSVSISESIANLSIHAQSGALTINQYSQCLWASNHYRYRR